MRSVVPESWGRFPRATPRSVEDVAWISDLQLHGDLRPILAYGLGRSYGDVCLNDGGHVLAMEHCNHILGFDQEKGLLRAEAGLSIADLLTVTIPYGWFVPVTPGTKYVTIGGALANDVHGKNHHRVGTFGCHVLQFELLRSDGSRVTCSRNSNVELFSATIGGLGLTGVVTWVEIRLLRIASRRIEEESIKVNSLGEVVRVTEESDETWDYTVSWVDVTTRGAKLGKGLVLRGRFANTLDATLATRSAEPRITIPFQAPSWLLSNPTIKVFNTLWYGKQFSSIVRRTVDCEAFFYPLDSIGRWNLLYGKRGMLQYQCVVPRDGGLESMQAILSELQRGRVSSFLAVVKKFGNIASPGILSFPRPGLTLTLDMPNTGQKLFDALHRCDEIVQSVGGRVYAAKDARINGRMFRAMYPELDRFLPFVDPAMSSSFWRRINSDQ